MRTAAVAVQSRIAISKPTARAVSQEAWPLSYQEGWMRAWPELPLEDGYKKLFPWWREFHSCPAHRRSCGVILGEDDDRETPPSSADFDPVANAEAWLRPPGGRQQPRYPILLRIRGLELPGPFRSVLCSTCRLTRKVLTEKTARRARHTWDVGQTMEGMKCGTRTNMPRSAAFFSNTLSLPRHSSQFTMAGSLAPAGPPLSSTRQALFRSQPFRQYSSPYSATGLSTNDSSTNAGRNGATFSKHTSAKANELDERVSAEPSTASTKVPPVAVQTDGHRMAVSIGRPRGGTGSFEIQGDNAQSNICKGFLVSEYCR